MAILRSARTEGCSVLTNQIAPIEARGAGYAGVGGLGSPAYYKKGIYAPLRRGGGGCRSG